MFVKYTASAGGASTNNSQLITSDSDHYRGLSVGSSAAAGRTTHAQTGADESAGRRVTLDTTGPRRRTRRLIDCLLLTTDPFLLRTAHRNLTK